MHLFLAGTTVSNPKEEKKLQQLFTQGHKLHSYYHCVNGFEKKWFKTNMKNKVDLFLDSGAFSAWSQKVDIDVHDYIKFIKKHKKKIGVYANLDVIGDAKATWKNQKIMEDAGLKPLPVYHLEDDIKYLDKCLDKYDYFCVGGMAKGYSAISRQGFLDRCFEVICDTPDKMPRAKIHGFGLTSLSLLFRYPWYSVDSTTWVITGRMGAILIPQFKNGKWDYSVQPNKVNVSSKSPGLSDKDGHIETTLKAGEKNLWMKYITDHGYKLGLSEMTMVDHAHKLKDNERWAEKKLEKPKKHEARWIEIIHEVGLCNSYQLRDELNIIYFLELEKNMRKWPWPYVEEKQAPLQY